MIRKLELLVPQFLKDIDKKLLLHAPGVWATKIHYALFFGLAWLGLLGLRLLTQSIDLADVPKWENHALVLLAPAILAFGIWVYYISRFDVGKYFGKRDKYSAALTHWLYLGAILLIFAGPLFYPGMLQEKIRMTANAVDLESDIHTLNMGDVYFPIHDLEVRKYPDDFYTVHRKKDAQDVEALIAEHKVLTPAQRIAAIEDFKQVFEKFSDFEFEEGGQVILSQYNQGKFDRFNIREYRFARESVGRNLRNTHYYQTKRNPLLHKDFLFSLFCIFYLWMATMVFLRIGWKAFLVSVAVGMGVIMLTGTLFGILGFKSIGFVFYLVVLTLLIGAFHEGTSKRSRLFQTVCLTIAIAMLPLSLLVLGANSYSGSGDSSPIILMFLGSAITYIFWATLFEQRFIDLKTAPIKR